MTEDTRPLMVTIRCLTYNHEPYIRQCLEGFVIQKTNFRYEAIVHDDASTDGTAAIIKEYAEKYPDIIKPIYETVNQYSKHDGSLRKILDKHTHGKYVALCEGDDYWTDPYKLQMQVDYLERNTEYGLVYCQCLKYKQKSNRFIRLFGGINESFCNLIKENTIPTLTVLFRNDIYIQYIEEILKKSQGWMMGDYPLWLFFAQKSKIKFIPKVVGVYRVLTNSASHSPDFSYMEKFIKSEFDMKRYFCNKYGINIYLEDSLNLSLAKYAFFCKNREKTIIYLNRVSSLSNKYKMIRYASKSLLTFYIAHLLYICTRP